MPSTHVLIIDLRLLCCHLASYEDEKSDDHVIWDRHYTLKVGILTMHVSCLKFTFTSKLDIQRKHNERYRASAAFSCVVPLKDFIHRLDS